MNRFNKLSWGVLVGLLAPFLALTLIYLGVDPEIDFTDKDHLTLNLTRLSPFLRLSLIANMLFFIPFGHRPKVKFLKGLIGATMLYGIVIVIIHFL
ncbi:MAG: hypothetical protein ACI8SE_000527 [Bacteroidia bacterium]|jgi:hypothetical protein